MDGRSPSLGYDVQNRKLVVNEQEALTVLHIFRRYVELRSVRALQAELDGAGIRSKRRSLCGRHPGMAARSSPAAPSISCFRTASIAVRSRTKGMPIPASIRRSSKRRCGTRSRRCLPRTASIGQRERMPSSQACSPAWSSTRTGERLTPTHAVKKGTRYRYYVSTSLITGAAKNHSNGRRMPAANLENLVITRLRTFLADQGAILDAIQNRSRWVGQTRLIDRGRQIAEELGTLAPDKIRANADGTAQPRRYQIRPRRDQYPAMPPRRTACCATD